MKEAADLKALFANFERSAFRLETLDRYTVPAEEEALIAFKAGRPTPPRTINTEPWLRVVNDATQAGKHISRVHIIGTPHTDYIRFELDAYAANVEVGEDIRIGHRSDVPAELLVMPDFWLFDDRTVAVMRYDEAGGFLGAEDATADMLHSARAVREMAVRTSVDYRDYMAGDAAVG